MSDNICINIKGLAGLAVPVVALFLIKSARDVVFKWLDNRREEIQRIPPVESPVPGNNLATSGLKIVDNYVKK